MRPRETVQPLGETTVRLENRDEAEVALQAISRQYDHMSGERKLTFEEESIASYLVDQLSMAVHIGKNVTAEYGPPYGALVLDAITKFANAQDHQLATQANYMLRMYKGIAGYN